MVSLQTQQISSDLSIIAKPILLTEFLSIYKRNNEFLLFRLNTNDNITFKTSKSSGLSPAKSNDCIQGNSSGFKPKLKWKSDIYLNIYYDFLKFETIVDKIVTKIPILIL